MQHVRISILALFAALALSGIAVASASGSSFLVHPAGPVIGVNTNDQIFTVNGGQVTCKRATLQSFTLLLRSLHLLVNALYSECSAFSFPADVEVAELLLSADLKVSVENDILIVVLAGALGNCTVLVGPAGNQNLNAVHYGNEGPTLKLNALVKGITYTSTGGACGAGGNNGTYTGQFILQSGLGGGVIRWDKE